MFCSKCGKKAIDGAVFCQKCGAKLIQDNGEERSASVPEQEPVEMPIPSVRTPLGAGQKSAKEKESVPESKSAQVLSSKSTETSTVPVESMTVSSSGSAKMTASATESTQKINIQEQTSSMPGNDADIYMLLKEKICMCPSIKSAKQGKKGVRLRGRIYSHSVRLVTKHTMQARIRSVLAFPFSILYGLFIGLLCITIGILLQELIKYHSICIEYYHYILFALCSLVTGGFLFMHSCIGRKEKAALKTYVSDVLGPKRICVAEKKWADVSKIRIAAAVALGLAGIVILPFSLPGLKDSIEYPDELLFDGLPAVRFLGMTQEDVELEYGEPSYVGQNETTAEDYYNYDGFGHVTYSEETGEVIYIQLDAIYCSCNGKKLDKSLERVLDILDEKYRELNYSFGVYGSIHNGFYYGNVYYGDIYSDVIPSAEDYMAQWEFQDSRDSYYYFMRLIAYGEKYYDSGLSSYVSEALDYNIDLICMAHKILDDLNGVYYVCLYTDEWLEKMNATIDSSGQTGTGENDSSNRGEILYDGIPVSQFFALSADELVEVLGTPVVYDEYMLAYDDIDFELDGNGKIISAETFFPEKLMIDGVTLDKGKNELIALLGNPSDEGEGGSGYQLEFSLEGCRVVTAMDEDIAWRVWLYPPESQSGESVYNAIDLNYRGESVADWIGGLPEDAYDVFGWPDNGTIVDGYLYEGGEYFGYTDGVLFVMDYQTGQISWIIGDTSSIMGNGYTLDKTRDELIEILGTPTMEEYAYNDMDDTSSYYMQYIFDSVQLLLNMPDAASMAETFIISQIVE